MKGLAPGTNVNVTYLVGADINESLDICDRLVQGGMKPVAHVPARAFLTLSDVEDYLSKLHDLGCREVLVLGGGAAEPVGDLHESMQILESGLFPGSGRISVTNEICIPDQLANGCTGSLLFRNTTSSSSSSSPSPAAANNCR